MWAVGASHRELFYLLFSLFLLLLLARPPLRPFPWPLFSPLRSVLLLQVGSSALSVVTINIVNLVMPYVLNKLSEIERHQTRSYEAISTTRALLIMYFLNTAITVRREGTEGEAWICTSSRFMNVRL